MLPNKHTVTFGDIQGCFIGTHRGHKGVNGKVLVIGGSSLFHSPALWAAELLAHFADLVFFYSPYQMNRELFLATKKQFVNGIVVTDRDLESYVEESDVVLMGPGMMRQSDEGALTRKLTHALLSRYPKKKWVLDAGALQALSLEDCTPGMIFTPHWRELNDLVPYHGDPDSTEDLLNFFEALKIHPGTWLVKRNGTDWIMSQELADMWCSAGGNEGLTKGGTGDVLAALVAALYIDNKAHLACAAASYILKQAADRLHNKVGPYFTTSELLQTLPEVAWNTLSKTQR